VERRRKDMINMNNEAMKGRKKSRKRGGKN
jgi:hypothetical protein